MSKYRDGMSQLAAADVVTAATQLMHAGQWAAATSLLTAAEAEDAAEREVLALALAGVAVDEDFGLQTDHAPAALAAADAVLNGSWDLAMLKLRKDYSTALFHSGDRDLRGRVLMLIEKAPDEARQGTANFYAGVIADNLHEQPAQAVEHYNAALELGQKCDDELLVSLALRHLGHHAHTAGDLALARTQWERSTELLQKVGHLRATLAQQAILATLLRDEGDAAGSRALATEVNRWARHLDLPFVIQETAKLMT